MASCLQEPWDGPALFAFSDGRYCGANLDRNGLRPCRYVVTNEDIMVCASEVGAVYIAPEKVVSKGRLKPGRMLLVDTQEGRIVDDKELRAFANRRDVKLKCEELLQGLVGGSSTGTPLAVDNLDLFASSVSVFMQILFVSQILTYF